MQSGYYQALSLGCKNLLLRGLTCLGAVDGTANDSEDGAAVGQDPEGVLENAATKDQRDGEAHTLAQPVLDAPQPGALKLMEGRECECHREWVLGWA